MHNLSEQSDSSELIGGYRPVQLRHIFAPLCARFESAFCRTFSRARNAALLEKLAHEMEDNNHSDLDPNCPNVIVVDTVFTMQNGEKKLGNQDALNKLMSQIVRAGRAAPQAAAGARRGEESGT